MRSLTPNYGSILFAEANSLNDAIFTLAYRLDDIIFTPMNGFGHLLAFFLPGLRLRLGAMAGFCETLDGPIF